MTDIAKEAQALLAEIPACDVEFGKIVVADEALALPARPAESVRELRTAVSSDPMPDPGVPAGDPDLYLKEKVFLQSFAPDLPARTASTITLYASAELGRRAHGSAWLYCHA